MATTNEDRWLSIAQVAALAGVSKQTPRGWMDRQGLPASEQRKGLVTLRRVRESDLRAWAAERGVPLKSEDGGNGDAESTD